MPMQDRVNLETLDFKAKSENNHFVGSHCKLTTGRVNNIRSDSLRNEIFQKVTSP